MEDQITELAELLSSTSLTDEAFKDRDLWEKRVAPITRPFLQAVMERFQDRVREQLETTLEIRYKSKPRTGQVKKRATTRDSAGVVIPVKSGGIKNFSVGIRLGVADYLENELVWGADWWGKTANVSRVEELFKETKREDEEVKVARDMMFGGISCYLIKSLSPSELRSRGEEDLIEEMAADLFDAYERVLKVVEKIDEEDGEDDGDSEHMFDRLGRYFAAQGFHFTPHQLATFYTALKTKGFVILSGISGTGKTKMAQLFADLMSSPEAEVSKEPRENSLFVPVRPDWRDSKSLLGYFNPLTGSFESTEFLRFILKALEEYQEQGKEAFPCFIILDEMNLARVEYYFADFLSVVESGRSGDGWTKEAIVLHDFRTPVEDADGNLVSAQIKLPPNLYFVGTVNVDETTYMFSPKVLDRAFTIEFTEVDLTKYPTGESPGLLDEKLKELRQQLLEDFARGGRFAIVGKEAVSDFAAKHSQYREHLQTLNSYLQPYDLHFAYRVFDEIMAFLANAEDSPVFAGFTDLDEAFDTAVLMKVLPKFHGPRGKLEKPLQVLLAWAFQPGNPGEGWARLKPGLDDETKKWTKWQESLEIEGLEAFLAELNCVYPRSARKALRMLRSLYTTGFASFA